VGKNVVGVEFGNALGDLDGLVQAVQVLEGAAQAVEGVGEGGVGGQRLAVIRLGRKQLILRPPTEIENQPCWSILILMAENMLEFAQKMAQAARAGLAVERKRLKEILAERQRKQLPQPTQHSR
jgi:hypothetical protein